LGQLATNVLVNPTTNIVQKTRPEFGVFANDMCIDGLSHLSFEIQNKKFHGKLAIPWISKDSSPEKGEVQDFAGLVPFRRSTDCTLFGVPMRVCALRNMFHPG
jgi:hypothetical protein